MFRIYRIIEGITEMFSEQNMILTSRHTCAIWIECNCLSLRLENPLMFVFPFMRIDINSLV